MSLDPVVAHIELNVIEQAANVLRRTTSAGDGAGSSGLWRGDYRD